MAVHTRPLKFSTEGGGSKDPVSRANYRILLTPIKTIYPESSVWVHVFTMSIPAWNSLSKIFKEDPCTKTTTDEAIKLSKKIINRSNSLKWTVLERLKNAWDQALKLVQTNSSRSQTEDYNRWKRNVALKGLEHKVKKGSYSSKKRGKLEDDSRSIRRTG